jgi:hypothetical protein
VQEIMLEHPDYKSRKAMLRRYRDLYTGGEQLKSNGADYLVQRQKEPSEVYQERLSRVFYENYIGSIIDWYVATLLRREPVLISRGDDEAAKLFFARFADSCDRKGTSLAEFFRKRILDALITGSSYILIDFPKANILPGNRAEEDAHGYSDAYLIDYSSEQLINWSYDDIGAYDWVVLKTTYLRKQSVKDKEWHAETRWSYYDKQRFEVYRSVGNETDSKVVELIDSGFHCLARKSQVPLFALNIPQGLWLMNKAGLLQLEHFNKSNALSWALTMGLFATPVVYSDREWNQIMGESYYIQLGPQDRFGWTEPEGTVFQIAAANLTRLQEEIYRVCYLMSQAGGPLAGGAQSGISKQRDFAITQEVLRAYGDAVKDTMKRVLRGIADAREDRLDVDVSGMDEFDIGDFTNELADAERLLGLGIGSTTLRRQVFKKLAYKYLCDVRQETKDQIAREIDEEANRQ